jgi:hypothetical protein
MLQNLHTQVERQFFTFAVPTRRWISSVGLALAVGVAYFLAARFSLNLMAWQFSGLPRVSRLASSSHLGRAHDCQLPQGQSPQPLWLIS